MSESWTSGKGDGEAQDLVSERDGKAEVLADAVVAREGYEKRTAHIVVGALIFIQVLCFTALAFGVERVNNVADANTKVVCNLRDGYADSLKSTNRFLAANPHGGTLLGVEFTRDDLIKQRRALQARLDSTKDAQC